MKLLKNRKHISGDGKLICDRNSILLFAEGSGIRIAKSLVLNANCFKNNKRSSILRLDKGAKLNVTGTASIYYDADVILFENSTLNIGNRQYVMTSHLQFRGFTRIIASEKNNKWYGSYRMQKEVITNAL